MQAEEDVQPLTCKNTYGRGGARAAPPGGAGPDQRGRDLQRSRQHQTAALGDSGDVAAHRLVEVGRRLADAPRASTTPSVRCRRRRRARARTTPAVVHDSMATRRPTPCSAPCQLICPAPRASRPGRRRPRRPRIPRRRASLRRTRRGGGAPHRPGTRPQGHGQTTGGDDEGAGEQDGPDLDEAPGAQAQLAQRVTPEVETVPQRGVEEPGPRKTGPAATPAHNHPRTVAGDGADSVRTGAAPGAGTRGGHRADGRG